MNFLKLGLILTFFAVFVFACSRAENSGGNVSVNTQTAVNLTPVGNGSPSLPAVDELASVRKIYAETCAGCHKENGIGGVSEIEGKRIKAPNFTSDRQKSEPDSEYIEVIENGEKEDGMPAYKGKISDEDIKNLVKYIRREFQGK